MPDIFLSYSHDDRVFMDILLNNLRKLGFNVWIDEEQTVGTPEWERAIMEAVYSVDALVVIMTPSSEASRWVNIELQLADLYGTPIFPILAAGDELTAVPARLLGMRYADMRGRSDYETGFRQLVNGLAEHAGLAVSEFSMDVSGEPRVQVNMYGQNEGTIVAVGRDVAGGVTAAGGDVIGGDYIAGDKAVGIVEELNERTLALLPPPFEWLPIPAGQVTLKDDAGTFDAQPFLLAKYPITYAQFRVFIDASDGFYSNQWWQGLAKREAEPGRQAWPVDNHPRESVSWCDAVAFCRWLSSKLGYDVRLPTEWEWQWAAQGSDGRSYPWGDNFDSSHCNTGKSRIRRTTPVDAYPSGASPFGVRDMAGNVWEWCLNEYEAPANIQPGGDARRVVRGGSWDYGVNLARAAYRFNSDPLYRLSINGFRVCVAVPALC